MTYFTGENTVDTIFFTKFEKKINYFQTQLTRLEHTVSYICLMKEKQEKIVFTSFSQKTSVPNLSLDKGNILQCCSIC